MLGSAALTRATRAFYRMPGYAAVVRRARRRVVARSTGMVVSRSGYPVWLDEDTYDFVVPYLREVYEPELSRFVTGLLRPGDVFVDVGANIGHFSFVASPVVGDGGEVIAIEPDPLAFHALQRNIGAGGYRNIRAVNAAVAAEEGSVTLYRSAFGGGMNSLISSPESAGREPVEVRAAPLDALVQGGARGIKIDVEGAEAIVLAGMEEVIARSPEAWVLVEWRPWFLAQWADGDASSPLPALRRLGLRPYVIDADHELRLQRVSETGAEYTQTRNYNVLGVRADSEVERLALELTQS